MRELERELPTDAALVADVLPYPSLAVIGPGRAGTSIAAGATRAGLTISLAGRHDAVAACQNAEVALLCIPDSEIRAACATVATAIPPLRFVGHTSGVTALDALSVASEAGAVVFSLHPLQTIPDDQSELVDAPCAVAGSTPAALALATDLATRLEMRPFEVPEESRATYHAAAAMASNLLVALEECAADLLDRAGLDYSSRELLTPLVLRTAANWAERGPDALTGPIARGDAATVERHLDALRATAPELVPVYESLAERAQALAAPGEAGT